MQGHSPLDVFSALPPFPLQLRERNRMNRFYGFWGFAAALGLWAGCSSDSASDADGGAGGSNIGKADAGSDSGTLTSKPDASANREGGVGDASLDNGGGQVSDGGAGDVADGGGTGEGGADAAEGGDGLPSVSTLMATCKSMKGQTFGGVTVTDAQRIEANPTTHSAGFCQITATSKPYLDMEVDVPDNWSGRLWHQGGSGFDGVVPSAFTLTNGVVTAVNPALAQKASIYAASNGGNRKSVPTEAAPMVWGNGTEEGRASGDDFAYQGVGKTMNFAKSIAKAFFGRVPSRSYFNGCSNGGRNAYIAAQRWPGEYDGIVAGCEGMDVAGQTVAWMNVGKVAGSAVAATKEQYGAAFEAAVTACDDLDGVKDGVIANPQACKFDPAELNCSRLSASTCLSDAQEATLRAKLTDVSLPNGLKVYSQYSWANFFVADDPVYGFGLIGSGFALLATNDPNWLKPAKWASFVPASDYYIFANGLSRRGADHDMAAIASFVSSGKKLLSWHDGADNLVSPNDHVRNHTAMTNIAKTMGLADPNANTRFFIVPGGWHTDGQKLTEVDWASAIMDWVEKGTAPVQLTYAFTLRGATTPRSMPVCQYPKFPKYSGSGDVNSATSYTCT